MCHPSALRFRSPHAVGWAAVLATLCWAAAAPAQSARVDDLTQALRSRGADRDIRVKKAAAAIKTMSDLRQALVLTQWRGGLGGRDTSDQVVRAQLGRRFQAKIRAGARSRDATTRLAIAKLIGQIGISIPGLSSRDVSGLGRTFAPDLVVLSRDRDLQVRTAAARSLGKINADPNLAAPVWQKLLKSKNLALRRAAADGVANEFSLVIPLAKGGQKAGDIRTSPADLRALGQKVVPLLGVGLKDSDVRVRRRTASATQEAAVLLAGLVPLALTSADQDETVGRLRDVRRLYQECESVAAKLGVLGPVLAKLLDDRDRRTRILAARALSDMANAYRRLRSARKSMQEEPIPKPKPDDEGEADKVSYQDRRETESPLLKGLKPAVARLQKGIRGSTREKLAAIDFLELLGPEAAPAGPALVQALADRSLFVRWAAARTLSKIGKKNVPASAVPALARLMADPDLDVRLAAAATLEYYGPMARRATAAVVRATQRGDAEVRVAAMRALETIGKPPRSVIQALVAALSNSDNRVRQVAAETLGSFGRAARTAVPALRKALRDSNEDVRRAASEALLDVRQ
jgi:HEAT repeat protein